jgi:hypothetical protein
MLSLIGEDNGAPKTRATSLTLMRDGSISLLKPAIFETVAAI